MSEKNKISLDVAAKSSHKKGNRFNLIDFLIILVVLLLVAVVVNIFAPMSWFDRFSRSSDVKIQYTVEFLGVDEQFVDKIKEEDLAVDSVSKNSLGKVKAVDNTQEYTALSYDEESKAGVLSAYPDKYNVLVTVEVDAEYREEKGYSINDLRIAVGEKMSLRFPDYAGEGYCISVSVVG